MGVKLAKGQPAVGAAEFVAVSMMAFGSSALKALRAVTLQALLLLVVLHIMKPSSELFEGQAGPVFVCASCSRSLRGATTWPLLHCHQVYWHARP